MLFFGMFCLVVLPLFLLVSAQMVRRGEFGKSAAGKVLAVILYLCALASVIFSLTIIFKLF